MNQILPPWPIGAARAYQQVIVNQGIAKRIPPELLASILTAEQLDYNIGDWLFDDEQFFHPDERSIGIAQIRVDEVTRFTPMAFSSETSISAIRDVLLDNNSAIGILALLLKRHLESHPVPAVQEKIRNDLDNWNNLTYQQRENLVFAFARAKDNGGFVGSEGQLSSLAKEAFREVRQDGRFAPPPIQ